MGSNNSRVFAVLYTSHERKHNGQIVSILFSDELTRYEHPGRLQSPDAKKMFDRYGIDNNYVTRHGEIHLRPKQGYTNLQVKIALNELEKRGFYVHSYSWSNGDARVENWVTAPKSGVFSWHQVPNACVKLKLKCTKEHNTTYEIPIELSYRMYKATGYTNGQFHYITPRDTNRESFAQPRYSLPFIVWVEYTPSPPFKIS
jgi:hypothetical protein